MPGRGPKERSNNYCRILDVLFSWLKAKKQMKPDSNCSSDPNWTAPGSI